jgi:hypothetical protein
VDRELLKVRALFSVVHAYSVLGCGPQGRLCCLLLVCCCLQVKRLDEHEILVALVFLKMSVPAVATSGATPRIRRQVR